MTIGRPAAATVAGLLMLASCVGTEEPTGEPSSSASVVLQSDRPSPSVAAASATAEPSPSPPPAQPITESVIEDGIRLTVTLDRDRTEFGERVHAEATVENIGSDVVFWGHSSSCVYPASLLVGPDDPMRPSYGREDWPGESGTLKLVTVDQRTSGFDPEFSFLPAEWLDSDENFACTSDLAISELAPGESLPQQLGWDTLGLYGMPPPPGSYTVDAAFHFMSRGGRPAPEAGTDAFSVDLTLPIAIDGPEVDYLSPGEAVDALLADPAFQEHLAGAPQRRWLQSDIEFADGRWQTALYIQASATEVEPVLAIVATIDARTGVVGDVGLETRSP